MSKKINILVDGHVFDGIFQGSRTYLRGLYSSLADSDYLRIHIAANDLKNLEREFECVKGNINFVKLHSRSKYIRLAWEFPRLINKYKFDYVHYQYIDALTKACKTIITIHDVLFLEFRDDFSWLYRQKKYLFKRAASRADILTTDSNYSKQAITEYLNIQPDLIHVVPPALDEKFFDLSDKMEVSKYTERTFSLKKYILYVSRVEPRKNHILLLHAFHDLELWKHGYKLVFVGKKSIPAPAMESFLSQVKSEEKEHILHLESVSFDDLIQLIAGASIFVYPSGAEGFGYPPIEAGAMGTETLLSNATCLSEFDFFGDRFFEPDDLHGLKLKLNKIISGEGMKTKMEFIQDEIHKKFRWNLVSQQFENLIIRDFMGDK